MSNDQLNKPRTQTSIDKLDILNTLAVSKYLKKFKFTDIQAEALSNILKKNRDDMISQKDVANTLVTKSDLTGAITQVRDEIRDVRNEISNIKVSIAELKVSTIKWQVGTTLILASLFTTLLRF